MKKWTSQNKLYIIGAGFGCLAGFFYWQQIGCASGTCMITSSPVNSSIYGATMGALLLGTFKRNKQPAQESKKKEL